MSVNKWQQVPLPCKVNLATQEHSTSLNVASEDNQILDNLENKVPKTKKKKKKKKKKIQ